MKSSTKIARFLSITAIACAFILAPLIVISIMRVDTSSSEVQPWFPDDTPEREQLLAFEKVFGPQDFWLVALDDPERNIEPGELAREIREIDKSRQGPQLLASVLSGGDFLAGKSEAEKSTLRESLAGIFFSHDGGREAIFIRSADPGFFDRVAVYELITEAATALEIPQKALRITGSGYLGVMMDRETQETLAMVTPVTFILSVLFAWILMHDLKTAGIALFASGIAAGIPVVAIYFSGNSMNHLVVVVPSLAQLLALSNAVHLIQYYKDAVKSKNPEGPHPAIVALKNGLKPTVAACLTTAIGFLALQHSSLPVVRSFSLFGTLSVIGAMITVLTLVPASLFLLRPGVGRDDVIERVLMPWLDKTVKRFRTPLAYGLLGLIFVSFWGITRLKTEVRMETFFSEESEFTANHNWFNREFGEVQSTQIFGAFDQSVPSLKQLKRLSTLVGQLQSEGTGLKTFSIAELLPEDVGLLDLVPPEAINDLMTRAGDLNFYSEYDGKHFWKVTVFDQPYPDVSSSVTVKKIKAVLNRMREAEGDLAVPWVITGNYILFGSAQETLLRELLQTFLLAFVLITPCIILFLRNVRFGLIAMIGNTFPIAVFFGAMGFLGFRIDIATMVTASIAFGIAIDDTVHFLARLAEPGEGEDAVSLAFRKAGSAISKTTVIISIGMLAFLLSDFDPSRRFAICTSIVLVLAVVGDLILLPALIRGPLARFFPVGKT